MSDDMTDYLDGLEPGDKRPPVIDRARADLAARRPWVAANRLQSHLADDPFDHASRDLLVQVHLDMGDLMAAGRVAIATERDDAAVLEAIAAWRAEFERVPGTEASRLRSQGLLNAEVIARLGPIGRSRVEPLADLAREELGPFEERDYSDGRTSLADRAIATGCSVGCLGVVGVFTAGVIQIVRWLSL